jgi:predicted oxidoreductase
MIDNCQDFVVADTIEELTAKMNKLQGTSDVDVRNVREAVNDYDANMTGEEAI